MPQPSSGDEGVVDMDSITDPARIAELVLEGRTSRVRRVAAERVDDPAQLRALLKRVRGSDKAVYKILRQKCDVLIAEGRRRDQFAADVQALCDALDRHSKRTPDATYAATLDYLVGRWRALTPTPDAASEERCLEAIARCREVIAGQARQVSEQEARRAAAQEAAALREREREAARAAAEAAAAAAARSHQEAIDAQAAEALVRSEREAAQERLVRQLGGLIRKANESLQNGSTQQAAGLRRAIGEKWAADFAAPSHLARQLEQLDGRLAELKGWKDFAVAPKRLELIGEMEALIGSEEEPQALARRIQALQADWRTISKGIVSEAPEDWERFHQASQTAYGPCRDFFERQAERRRVNLESRRALLGRLTAFEAAHNGGQSDWRLVMQVLREAPLEWRRYFPVERDNNRALQAEFEAALGRLQATLDAWHERNEADKQSLIKRARHLAAQEDTREAIETAKRLQILWRDTGQASRAHEQALWSEFREVCDSIYRRRDQAHADYTAGLEAAKREAERLCEEVEQTAAGAAAAAPPELKSAAEKIPEWRAAFESLEEMPRAEARAVHDRFERAILRLESEIARGRGRDAERAIDQLFEALGHLRAYEWAESQAADDREALKGIAERFIEAVPRWPRGALALVKEALRRAQGGLVDDPDAAEKALRLLCIRAEIRAEAPTPDEDASLRREYQVQRLMTGMGQGGRAPHDPSAGGVPGDDPEAADWDALVLAWIPVGNVASAVHSALQARFRGSLGHRPVARPQRSTFHDDREPREAAGRRDQPSRARRRNS